MAWDVVLEVDGWTRRVLEDEQQQAKVGAVDSAARGLVRIAPLDSAAFRPFAKRFFAEAVVRRGPDSTTILSPISAALALSMVLPGARGETASRIASVLEPGGTAAFISSRSSALATSMKGRTDVVLEIANSIWVDSSLVLQPSYERAVVSTHNASVRALTLASGAALARINDWVDSATRGKIKGILDRPLSGNTALFVANAVYFKGKWLEPFPKESTRDGDFAVAPGRRVRVPMMERTGRYGYVRKTSYQVVRLPYRGGRTAMYVILPDSGASLDALVRQLDGAWPASLREADSRDVRVILPRFTVEQTHDLAPILTTLGMQIAFDGRADFGAIAQPRGGGTPIPMFIGGAVQKVFVQVDEEGTEAAAVTGLDMITSLPPPPIQFVVDRPFVFVLRDEVSGADLFVGRVADPR